MTVTITKERITPTAAAKYLNGNNSHNRPLNRKYVSTLVRAYRNGEWQDNGETIKFDKNGQLIDGQHRLRMLVDVGASRSFWVARGLEEESFDTIDQQKQRSLADVFHIHGEKYYGELSTAIRYHAMLVGIISNRGGMSNALGVQILTKKPVFRSHVSFMCDTGGCDLKRTGLFSPGIAAALYHSMRLKNRVMADKFWTQIGSGEQLAKNSAAWKMRDILMLNKNSPEKMTRDTMVALFIKAWNAYRDGKNFNRRLVSEDMTAKIK